MKIITAVLIMVWGDDDDDMDDEMTVSKQLTANKTNNTVMETDRDRTP